MWSRQPPVPNGRPGIGPLPGTGTRPVTASPSARADLRSGSASGRLFGSDRSAGLAPGHAPRGHAPGTAALAVLAAGEALKLVERVRRLDPAHGSGARAHHDRVRDRAVRQVA